MSKEEFFELLSLAWACWGGTTGCYRRDIADEIDAVPYWNERFGNKRMAWAMEWARETCTGWYENFDKYGVCRECGVSRYEHRPYGEGE